MNEIDNTYRNFSFEVLAGIKDTSVECKENGCLFRFDFAVTNLNKIQKLLKINHFNSIECLLEPTSWYRT